MFDFKEMIEKATGIPTEDTAFSKPQKLPFIVFLDKQDIDGDDALQARIIEHDLAVELYAERIDKTAESKIEAMFVGHGWIYSKDRVWLPDEKCFETIYTTNFYERVIES